MMFGLKVIIQRNLYLVKCLRVSVFKVLVNINDALKGDFEGAGQDILEGSLSFQAYRG